MSSTTSDKVPTTRPRGRRPGESKKMYDVRVGFKTGRLKCHHHDHFVLATDPVSPNFKTAVPATPQIILRLMSPFTLAKCECERTACEAAWSWNRPGMFQTEWVHPGSYQKGVLASGAKYDVYAPPSLVMPVPYRLKAPDIKVLHERFPGWIFVSTASDHGHPIAHASTQVAVWELVNRLGDGCYLDLDGNPTANERITNAPGSRVTINTMVSFESVQDHVREGTELGDEFRPQTMAADGTPNPRQVRYTKCSLRDLPTLHEQLLNTTDSLLAINTLYYYKKQEIANALRQTRRKTLYALIYRFKSKDSANPDQGSFNNGEQEWARHRTGDRATITQTDTLTGEVYEHPDIECWFGEKGFSWGPDTPQNISKWTPEEQAKENSLAWMVKRVYDDVYLVTAASVVNKCHTLNAVTTGVMSYYARE